MPRRLRSDKHAIDVQAARRILARGVRRGLRAHDGSSRLVGPVRSRSLWMCESSDTLAARELDREAAMAGPRCTWTSNNEQCVLAWGHAGAHVTSLSETSAIPVGTTAATTAPESPTFCPNCGTRAAGARFCPNCGTAMSAPSEAGVVAPIPTAPSLVTPAPVAPVSEPVVTAPTGTVSARRRF
jgi:hypothetical protein